MEKVFLSIIAGQASDAALIQVVQATLNFIYFTHFKSHNTKSLTKLEEAWVSFHMNKSVFVWLGIWKAFNIPKIHSMVHYIEAIWPWGSTDRFSTESPECLHINSTKATYCSKKYINQMTKWLTHQENCHCFNAYLYWACPDTMLFTIQGTTKEEEQGDADYSDAPGKGDDLSKISLRYFIAKCPAYPQIPVSLIIKDFGATDFLYCMEKYLKGIHGPHQTTLIPTETTCIDLFKCVSIEIPPASQVTDKVTKDVVWACHLELGSKRKEAVPGCFDTVLVNIEDGFNLAHPLGGESDHNPVLCRCL